MDKIIKKAVVKRIFHQNKLRISNSYLSTLEIELSKLVQEKINRIMRLVKVRGGKNINSSDWKD